MNLWRIASKISFFRVPLVINYIVEGKFQFLEVEMKVGRFRLPTKVYRGNNIDFAKPFLEYLSSIDARVDTRYFNSRKSFELLAATRPALKNIHFNWSQL